jgi:hypothetical protein
LRLLIFAIAASIEFWFLKTSAILVLFPLASLGTPGLWFGCILLILAVLFIWWRQWVTIVLGHKSFWSFERRPR